MGKNPVIIWMYKYVCHIYNKGWEFREHGLGMIAVLTFKRGLQFKLPLHVLYVCGSGSRFTPLGCCRFSRVNMKALRAVNKTVMLFTNIDILTAMDSILINRAINKIRSLDKVWPFEIFLQLASLNTGRILRSQLNDIVTPRHCVL